MKEEWIKVCRIITVDNLVTSKEFVDNTIEIWKELLDNYKIKYKFDIEQGTEYFDGIREIQYIDKVFSIYLYKTKEELPRMKSIIKESESDKFEVPEELKSLEEND